MAFPEDPTLQRHRLRLRLRELRNRMELSQRSVADSLGWSEAKVQRIEAGQVGVSRTDLKALLDLYGATEDDEFTELARLAAGGRRQPWGDYRDVLNAEYLVYLRYESASSRIRAFHPWTIPGLLQTEAYARSIIHALAIPNTPQRVLDRQIEARLARQAIFDRQPCPRAAFIIDEMAVTRPVGPLPDHGQIMRQQLERLQELAVHPSVTIQILPQRHGHHFGLNGPFILLDLTTSDGLPDGEMVYLETPDGGASIREDQTQIDFYNRTFADLATAATDPDNATEVLDRLMLQNESDQA